MDYKIYKMVFQGAVHLGKQSLEDGEFTFCADTLFSALCQEALKLGEDKLQAFYTYAKEGKLLLSDAFPYIGDTYYLPKPIKHLDTTDGKGDSAAKKAWKKLSYIPMEALDEYLRGDFDVLNMQAPDIGKLGSFEMKVSAFVRGQEETLPYRVGTYYYHPGNGIYLIARYDEPQKILLEELLENLSFSGIGGKRAAGMGRFTFYSRNVSSHLKKRLEGEGSTYMSLSVSLPADEELEQALLGAEYLVCKRSGFVASENYAPEQMRKKDLYVLKAGSCFRNKYKGDIYDVSGRMGKHPVYRYAKPIFIEVGT